MTTEEARQEFEKWVEESGWTERPFQRVDEDGNPADYNAPEYAEQEYEEPRHNIMWESWQAGARSREAEIAADAAELAHYRDLAQRDPYEYRVGHCCGDAHMELQSALEHLKLLGFEVETRKSENFTEVLWVNRRAESAEAQIAELKAQLTAITNYRPG
jgi:hypothetical protein